jgi:ATP-binding cassette, subfamily B (MDR/TAP), member 9
MFVRSFVFIIVAFVFLFIISWQLTLVMICSILPVIVFSIFYGRKMKFAQTEIQNRKAVISTVAEETFSNVRTVKAFATEDDEANRYFKGNSLVYDMGVVKAIWYGFFNFFANFFVFGSMVAILALGAKLCADGELTVGEITAFLFYMMQILINFMILAQVLGSIFSVVGASYKIVEMLEYKPRILTEGGIIPADES